MGKRIVLFFLIGLCAWNLTKIPYIVTFDSTDTTDEYARNGLEGSINLGHWVDGYHGLKQKSPEINFLAVHNVVGITVLMLMAISLVSPGFRRKWGLLFFSSAIVLGLHTIPAAWAMEGDFKKYLFTATCVEVIVVALWGLVVLRGYERYQPASEKHLLIAYSLIALGAYGAGFAEFSAIGSNVISRLRTSAWPEFGDAAHPLYGQTFYDRVPEAAGWAVFVLWITVVWIVLPARQYLASRSKRVSSG